MRNYRKYEVWEIGHKLTKEIYLLTSKFPKEEIYGLTSQIRRASVSIPTNIAEGCGRLTDKEFTNGFKNLLQQKVVFDIPNRKVSDNNG